LHSSRNRCFDEPDIFGLNSSQIFSKTSDASSHSKQQEEDIQDRSSINLRTLRTLNEDSRIAVRTHKTKERLRTHCLASVVQKLARPAPAEEPKEEEEEAEAEDEGSPVNSPPGSPAEESDAPIVLRLKRPGSSAPSEPEPFTCSECGKSFASAHALGGHKGSHRNREVSGGGIVGGLVRLASGVGVLRELSVVQDLL
jgi:hypothetical protein